MSANSVECDLNKALISWSGLLVKHPPLVSALGAVILPRLFVRRFNNLECVTILTLRAGYPPVVCALAVGNKHHAVGRHSGVLRCPHGSMKLRAKKRWIIFLAGSGSGDYVSWVLRG